MRARGEIQSAIFAGVLVNQDRGPHSEMHRQIIAEQLEAALRNSLQAPDLRLISLDGERPSVDARREPWIETKYGPASPDDWFGIVSARAQFERSAGKIAAVVT